MERIILVPKKKIAIGLAHAYKSNLIYKMIIFEDGDPSSGWEEKIKEAKVLYFCDLNETFSAVAEDLKNDFLLKKLSITDT